jgi:hypothetical protein
VDRCSLPPLRPPVAVFLEVVMADLHVAAGAQRDAQAALVALAAQADPGEAASDLDHAIVMLADEGHLDELDELLAPAAGPALFGLVTYRVDRHERGTLKPIDAEQLPDVVIAVRRFREAAGGLRGDESVLLFSAADGVERLLASAVAEGPARFHPPEPASFSGDSSGEAFASWDAQLARWAEADAVPEPSTEADPLTDGASDHWRARDEGFQGSDEPAALRSRIDALERQLEEREAELSRLRNELDRARDSIVGDGSAVPAPSSRGSGALRTFSRYRRSRNRPR